MMNPSTNIRCNMFIINNDAPVSTRRCIRV
jgi:hypothetical protein